MTIQQKKSILLALRNAAKILEEELEHDQVVPVLHKRRTYKRTAKEHIETTVALGIWRKPEHLRKTHRQ